MGRYYFHLRAGDEIRSDEEGQDLPNLSAAQREAVLVARELMSGEPEVPEAFVIADEAGRTLATVPLATVCRGLCVPKTQTRT